MGPTYARQVLGTQFEMHGNVAVTMCFITGLQVFHFARTLTIRVKSRSYNKNFIGFLVYSTMLEELFMLSKQQEQACKPKKLFHERDFSRPSTNPSVLCRDDIAAGYLRNVLQSIDWHKKFICQAERE